MESAANRFRIAEGDWICSDVHCRNINFARRNKCNRCGRDRAEGPVAVKKKFGREIGKVLADKSGGLFSADDWKCIRCGNVNWARRLQCNMCNVPKFGEVEERTGYGGGYNDRGIVEYIQRDDSDSEYDEFGRIKKKKGQKYSEDAYDKRNSVECDDDGNTLREDEDEEEDEDDEDLSKYDLCDWGVSSDDGKKEEKILDSQKDHTKNRNMKTSRRSRSRSPSWKHT